jgi:hypothetical protein
VKSAEHSESIKVLLASVNYAPRGYLLGFGVVAVSLLEELRRNKHLVSGMVLPIQFKVMTTSFTCGNEYLLQNRKRDPSPQAVGARRKIIFDIHDNVDN